MLSTHRDWGYDVLIPILETRKGLQVSDLLQFTQQAASWGSIANPLPSQPHKENKSTVTRNGSNVLPSVAIAPSALRDLSSSASCQHRNCWRPRYAHQALPAGPALHLTWLAEGPAGTQAPPLSSARPGSKGHSVSYRTNVHILPSAWRFPVAKIILSPKHQPVWHQIQNEQTRHLNSKGTK